MVFVSSSSPPHQFGGTRLLTAAQCHPQRTVALLVIGREVSSHGTQPVHHHIQLVADGEVEESLIVCCPIYMGGGRRGGKERGGKGRREEGRGGERRGEEGREEEEREGERKGGKGREGEGNGRRWGMRVDERGGEGKGRVAI